MFLLPIGMTLLLVMAGVVLRRRSLIWTGFAVLWLSSAPIASDFMIRAAEKWAERIEAVDAPRADAIVVLSGGRVVAPGVAGVSEWSDADRFFGGVELFQAGKAPLLVFTGGWAPWEPKARPEGDILIDYAKALGVPSGNMLTTGLVVNTEEEVSAVQALLLRKKPSATSAGIPVHILLVTSAFHMPRAQRLFERVGLRITPFPVDFKLSATHEQGVLDLLPSANALGKTEMALREIYGRLFYEVKALVF